MSTNYAKDNQMKKIITLFCLGLLLVNCSNDGDDIDEQVLEIIDEVTEASKSFKGDFVSAAHPTSGMVSVSADFKELSFTNFKTDNGPKLLVYLSTDADATAFVNLGDLKGIEGDYTYAIPEGTDLEKYKIVNIWCVDFSVGFGHAELKM